MVDGPYSTSCVHLKLILFLISFLRFPSQDHVLIPPRNLYVFKNLIAHWLLRQGSLSLSHTLILICNEDLQYIYELYVWDEHVALAQKNIEYWCIEIRIWSDHKNCFYVVTLPKDNYIWVVYGTTCSLKWTPCTWCVLMMNRTTCKKNRYIDRKIDRNVGFSWIAQKYQSWEVSIINASENAYVITQREWEMLTLIFYSF
jgi:hypothetical protein